MSTTIRLRRRVQWMDTDAAGIWHHATIIRWAEEAEAELHRELGVISQTFGNTPRVHIEFDYRMPVQFDDEVEVRLRVRDLGESSICYEVEVSRATEVVATGQMVAVLIDHATGRKRPWPERLRLALTAEE